MAVRCLEVIAAFVGWCTQFSPNILPYPQLRIRVHRVLFHRLRRLVPRFQNSGTPQAVEFRRWIFVLGRGAQEIWELVDKRGGLYGYFHFKRRILPSPRLTSKLVSQLNEERKSAGTRAGDPKQTSLKSRRTNTFSSCGKRIKSQLRCTLYVKTKFLHTLRNG